MKNTIYLKILKKGIAIFKKRCYNTQTEREKNVFLVGEKSQIKFFEKISKKVLTSRNSCDIILNVARQETTKCDGKWKHSSVGRASALQAEGHRFEPYCFHQ